MNLRHGVLALLLVTAIPASAQQAPSKQQVLDAMRRATTFYVNEVATQGGYHFDYTEDLSYGRSEHGEGATQVETQRAGTPRVAMAYLEAFDATGERLYLDAARSAANALMEGQLCSGGWDYIIEFDKAKRKRYPYRKEHDCASVNLPSSPPTTLDDNVTQACTRVLMRTDNALNFQDNTIHEAALYALNALTKAQYPNGAWPQRFHQPPDASQFPPLRASYPGDWPRQWPGETYRAHYTFNDNSISDCIDLMLEAGRIYKDPRFLQAAERGGEFILLAQMPEPQPAWAQQYDVKMHPAWARVFEPPSVTGGESQGILKTLILLYRETGQRKYLDAIPRALEYLERSVLTPPSPLTEAWRRFRPGTSVLARFYELKTNRPLYVTKGTMITARGLGSARPDGYQLSYTPESVITHYGVLTSGAQLPAIRKQYEAVAKSGSDQLRRPDKLHGLSPWESGDSGPTDRRPEAARVQALLDSMESRGAWTEAGVIGKADRMLSFFAARPMVLTINGRPAELRENDRVEIFAGTQPPLGRIIRSETFARNLEAMAAWVK
jgi:hypothetical protein